MPEDVQTILILDAHPLMRRGIVQLVAMESALRLVGEAGNGQQGLALARQLRPDLILLDLNMHGLSGLETLKALKAIGYNRTLVAEMIPFAPGRVEKTGKAMQQIVRM